MQLQKRMSKRLQFSKSDLASISDDILSRFCIGFYKDNSLTFKLRFSEKENFEYLLLRGISVLQADKYGNNTVHHAILMEKTQFLSFLLEG